MTEAHSRAPRQFVLLMLMALCGFGVVASLGQTKGPPAASAAAAYDYVGVGMSLMRIERDSGRVEILEQRNSPNMSLTLEQPRPWTWREIRIDGRPARPAEREPKGIGPAGLNNGE